MKDTFLWIEHRMKSFHESPLHAPGETNAQLTAEKFTLFQFETAG